MATVRTDISAINMNRNSRFCRTVDDLHFHESGKGNDEMKKTIHDSRNTIRDQNIPIEF